MKEKFICIKITASNHNLLINECIKEFISNYTDVNIKELNINFILERVCLYYLDRIDKPYKKH